jgi:gliding motility-associated-like protein
LITDTKNCKDSIPFAITQPDSLSATISVYHPKCYNQQGSFKINTSGGVTPYQYSINGAGYVSSDSFSGLSFGTYSIAIKDANSCVKTYTKTLINPPQFIATYQRDSVKCFGGNDGKITINASGGTWPYTYKKNTITQANNIFSILTPGTYFVQVFDSNNCRIDSNLVIHQYTAVSVATSKTQVNCYGFSTGVINVNANGGNAVYTYSINNGSYVSSSSFTGLPAGTYVIKTKDANGCIHTRNDTIVQNSAVAFVVQSTDNTCFKDSLGKVKLIASGGTAPYQFSFNALPYSAIDSFKNLPAGTYNFLVKDNLSCIANGSITINQPTQISFTATVDSIKCNKSVLGKIQMNVAGGTPNYMYSLNNAAFVTTNSYLNLPTGTYNVRIRDNNLCIRDTNIALYATDSFYFSFVLDSIPCYNFNNGKLTILGFGGAKPYSYNLDGGSYNSSNVFSNIASGNHSFSIRDAYNCVLNRAFTLLNPNKINVIRDSFKNNNCFGESKGAIFTSAYGGTGALSYKWSNGPTGLSNINLLPGTYSISVTDSKNCVEILSQNITSPTQLLVNVTTSKLKCFGDKDAMLSTAVSGGTPGYSYLWSTGSSADYLTDLTPGVYTISVTDNNNCKTSVTTIITQPDSLYYQLAVANSSCKGSNNGQINVTNLRGGTLPYSYSWSHGAGNISQVTNLVPQTKYFVTLTDFNGCKRVDSAFIDTAYALQATLDYISPKCPRSLMDLKIVMSNGQSPFKYKLGNLMNSSGVFTNFLCDKLNIEVEDNSGCKFFKTIDTRPTDTMVTELKNYVPLCEVANVWSSRLYVTGSIPPYSFNWPNAYLTFGDSAMHNKKGTYSVKVTDGNGCVISKTFSLVPLDSALQGYVSSKTNLRCFEIPEGEIRVTTSGGNQPYKYNWNNGDVSPIITNLSANFTYRLTISDRNNCKYELEDSLTQPTKLQFNYIKRDESCSRKEDGTISVRPYGGTAPNKKFAFSLDGKSFTDQSYYSGLAAGAYTVYVGDENQCVVSSPVIIDSGQRIQINLNRNNEIELGKSFQISPILKLNPDTIQNIRYRWVPDEGLSCADCLEPIFSGYAKQEYVLNVLYSDNCMDTASIVINVVNRDAFYVPTAFMPASDKDENKVFRAFGNNILRFTMRIYNRIGEKMFESNDINYGWDGTYKGENARADSYYYTIQYETLDKNKFEYKGDFVLIR